MRSLWSCFVAGFFACALIAVAVNTSTAESPAPGVQGISALRTPVPESGDLQRGLSEREQKLAQRESELKELEERLQVQEERVKARIDELQATQDSLAKIRDERAEQRKAIEASLVKTYETMAPKKAAEVVAVMEDDLAVELLLAMKPKKVAAVLDKMDSSRAMMLSSKIAARRPAASASKEGQVQP